MFKRTREILKNGKIRVINKSRRKYKRMSKVNVLYIEYELHFRFVWFLARQLAVQNDSLRQTKKKKEL